MSRPRALTVLSLFTGIGGLDLGLEWAGLRTVGQVEIDSFCRGVLEEWWPHVPKHDDVRTCVEWWRSKSRPPLDVICGGFPCQDVSDAGKRAGIDGERSGLWADFAATVRQLRPRYVLVENVAGLLARGMGRVVGDLAAIGYDCEWDCVPAAAVGAPHLRTRIFVVAHTHRETGAHVTTPPDRTTVEYQRDPGHRDASGHPPEGSEQSGRAAAGVARPLQKRIFTVPLSAAFRSWDAEPRGCRLAHGLPYGLVQQRLGAYGNAVVPQVAKYVGLCIVDFDRRMRR